MLFKSFIFLVGFGFTIIGFMYVILYLNLFTIEYSLFEYFNFIFKKLEVYYIPLGIILITFSLLKEE